MVTPWRRWWRRGGDDGDSAKDLARSHQIRRDLARSGEISPDPAGSHQIRQPTPRNSKNPGSTVEIGLPRHGKTPRYGGDRTSSARQNPKIRWRSDLLGTAKPQDTVEIDGGDWKPKRK
uniref:Uncharacterized protein n=1 Tax=Fagus sylvatica TaxID=28930 RepID=A0A2N9I8Q3_FAGSY